MKTYQQFDLSECYLSLFQRAKNESDHQLAIQIFYKIVYFSVKSKNNWVIKSLIEDELDYLNFLNLNFLAIDAIKLTPEKITKRINDKYLFQKYNFQNSNEFQFRKKSRYQLCACCHDFVLTCEEIQNFPLKNTSSYICEKFYLALTQPETHKRAFLVSRILEEYGDKLISKVDSDYTLLLFLWTRASKLGIHCSPIISLNEVNDNFLSSNNLKKILQIINTRNHEIDPLLDDLIEHFIKNDHFSMAYYLSLRFSSPFSRLQYSLLTSINYNGKNDVQIQKYLHQIQESLKYEF